MTYIYKCPSPLGEIVAQSDGEHLTGLWLEGQNNSGFPSELYREKEFPVFCKTRHWLDLYFGGSIPDFCPPLKLTGSPFRKAVWDILLTIPYGQTVTYGEIAKILAENKGIKKMSAQAVGGAVGHNPVSIIVPCHRVVGAGGNLTGYTGGIDKKISLLTIERVDMSNFFIPKK